MNPIKISRELLFSLSGLALISGGGLVTAAWIAFAILDPGHMLVTSPLWRPPDLQVVFGGVIMAQALPGSFAG